MFDCALISFFCVFPPPFLNSPLSPPDLFVFECSYEFHRDMLENPVNIALYV